MVKKRTEYETAMLGGKRVRFKKGALHRQLGIAEDKPIGVANLRKIKRAKTGSSVTIDKKKHKVTELLKRRAVFALNISGDD